MEMSVRATPDGYTLGMVSGSIATTAAGERSSSSSTGSPGRTPAATRPLAAAETSARNCLELTSDQPSGPGLLRTASSGRRVAFVTTTSVRFSWEPSW